MALSMRERQAITREMGRRYRRCGKRERGLMLDELCALTGYDRSYAARPLRERARGTAPSRRRRSTFTGDLPAQPLAVGEKDVGHTAAADLAGQPVAAVQQRTDVDGRGG